MIMADVSELNSGVISVVLTHLQSRQVSFRVRHPGARPICTTQHYWYVSDTQAVLSHTRICTRLSLLSSKAREDQLHPTLTKHNNNETKGKKGGTP
jgi:hypothetical protein